MEGTHGQVDCRWDVADVTRPLHSVSQTAGPFEGEGNHDILFNNKRCVVVEPGIVDATLQLMKPIAEYKREGNLYLSEFTLSGFARQDQES